MTSAYRNFVQSAKGGSLHHPLDNDDGWRKPACGAKAEHWETYGLTADEFTEQCRRWHVCSNCRWTTGLSGYFATSPVEHWKWTHDSR